MIIFFRSDNGNITAVQSETSLSTHTINALKWLFSGAELVESDHVDGTFIGPRREMITPWSTNAVEITKNMNIEGIERIEQFIPVKTTQTNDIDSSINSLKDESNPGYYKLALNRIHTEKEDIKDLSEPEYDRMLQRVYQNPGQDIFDINRDPESIIHIENIAQYNIKEGLALSDEEIEYLENLSKKLERPLTDSEVFGFSQVNSEHCRHKIFNGRFVIDGKEMDSSLFKMIKKTSSENPNRIVSAYKDNCAFIQGPHIDMFHPASGDKPDKFIIEKEETVISLKAETHNFPTTVEPFNGAATGSGGEIRDRIAGGKGSFPIAGTAVYMTSYPRFHKEDKETSLYGNIIPPRVWENTPERQWLYQSPKDILTKASNGASDFGNKFGQPLICGSLQTMEHTETDANGESRLYGFDKVIMLAGGVGYAKKRDSLKDQPEAGDSIIVMGGDNYRIGMGGGAVSSVNTGEYDNSIELNAIQRSNPEMQKRVYNTIRSAAESDNNPIVSIHDHGAGGHLNCLSELVENIGGDIYIDNLPVGDPTLSAKEIIGNESQERMGLLTKSEDVERLRRIAERERAPFYEVGETTGKGNFNLTNRKSSEVAIDLELADFFGSTPKTVLTDSTDTKTFSPIELDLNKMNYTEIISYLEQILQLESVACKDWLTNKVDRCVTGLVALQQTTGEIQLPLNNLGVTTIGYNNREGIATSIGHAPLTALIDPAAGSRIAIAEALTNIVWTPIEDGLKGVSLSANWMWPAKNDGENSRLYKAVKAASDFAIELKINIPTGKDSMSMTQKYPDGTKVLSPGTLIVSAVAQTKDVKKCVTPDIKPVKDSCILYIPFSECGFELGGSAFAQIINKIGDKAIDVTDANYFASSFNVIQQMVGEELILAGHDISSGGLVTALLEMNFPNSNSGMTIDISELGDLNALFSEKPGVVIQVADKDVERALKMCGEKGVKIYNIGRCEIGHNIFIDFSNDKSSVSLKLKIEDLRDIWYYTSFLMDDRQVTKGKANERFFNYSHQPLMYSFGEEFTGKLKDYVNSDRKYNAAIIRESGSNGDREMAWCLYQAGFNVRDVHMTDLVSGRETLEDINFIVFVGGFSNADTLGSAKGWAGAFLYNERAKTALDNFYKREDTLSLGVCNGCQLMGELGLITPLSKEISPTLHHNSSGKYECGFVGVTVEKSSSILLKSIEGNKLGVWVAHGEGRFHLPLSVDNYNIALRYTYDSYPANPNGSPEAIAGICSPDGRHLAMMPHPERSLMTWNWAYYPFERKNDEITPWIELFINGRKWIENNR